MLAAHCCLIVYDALPLLINRPSHVKYPLWRGNKGEEVNIKQADTCQNNHVSNAN